MTDTPRAPAWGRPLDGCWLHSMLVGMSFEHPARSKTMSPPRSNRGNRMISPPDWVHSWYRMFSSYHTLKARELTRNPNSTRIDVCCQNNSRVKIATDEASPQYTYDRVSWMGYRRVAKKVKRWLPALILRNYTDSFTGLHDVNGREHGSSQPPMQHIALQG